MSFIRLGDYNRMTVVKSVDFGLYLDGGDEGEVLLPARYVPDGCKEGDEIEVFVYLDSEERLVATTQTPKARVGDFAFLTVSWVNEYGAFLDWGLMKDLFCPFREQKMKMEKGKGYIVHVHLDNESHRIVPRPRWNIISTRRFRPTGTATKWTCWYGRRPTLASKSSSTTASPDSSTATRCSGKYTRATA